MSMAKLNRIMWPFLAKDLYDLCNIYVILRPAVLTRSMEPAVFRLPTCAGDTNLRFYKIRTGCGMGEKKYPPIMDA